MKLLTINVLTLATSMALATGPTYAPTAPITATPGGITTTTTRGMTVTPGPGACDDLAADCAQLSNLCEDPNLKDIMHRRCPKTCGVCVQTPECWDVAANCAELANECKDPQFTDLMNKDCVKTCGFCPDVTADCVDIATDCAQAGDKCTDPDFRDVMAARCTKTCGYCQYYECKDVAVDCEELTKECNDPDFTDYMHKNCAKTCKFCYEWVHSTSTGYWYKYLFDHQDSFSLLESLCTGFGGHLVSIHSKSENDYVLSQEHQLLPAYIGLHLEDGSLKWTDGTLLDYTNWDANQNHTGCNAIWPSDGKWGEVSCLNSQPGICKKRY